MLTQHYFWPVWIQKRPWQGNYRQAAVPKICSRKNARFKCHDLTFLGPPPIYGQHRSLPPTIPWANPIYFRFFRDWQQTYQFTEWSENSLSRFPKITITQKVSPESSNLLPKSDFFLSEQFEMPTRHEMTQTEVKKLNVVTMTSKCRSLTSNRKMWRSLPSLKSK